MHRRSELASALALLMATLGLLAWIAIPAVVAGPSSADDAWFALGAKALAEGRGFGTPVASDLFVPFDPQMNAGPPLIVPLAAAITILGPRDWLPGAVALVVFAAQLAFAAVILARRLGFSTTVAFTTTLLILVMLASSQQWYFGVFIGEPVTLGFLLIGIALLSVGTTDRLLVAAGVSLSLAYMTKTIALLPVLAILGTWFVLELTARTGPRQTARGAMLLAASVAIAPFAFEVLKLMTLGVDDYGRLIESTRTSWARQAQGDLPIGDRLMQTIEVVGQNYMPGTAALLLVGIGGILMTLRSRTADIGMTVIASRVFWLAAAASGATLVYFTVISRLWPRYAWIGIALACVAAAAPTMTVGRTLRLSWTVGLTGIVVGMVFLGPLVGIRNWMVTSTSQRERAATVALLASHDRVPYAAQYWSSIYDIVYLMEEEGTWFFGEDVSRLADREFIALINHGFTDPSSRFAQQVEASCHPLAQDRTYVTPYQCGAAFWSDYAPTQP
jgi:hypothetical protein